MGLPSKRRTTRSKKERASHFALTTKALATCSACGVKILPHRACSSCGAYKGKTVVDTKKRVARRAKRLRAIT